MKPSVRGSSIEGLRRELKDLRRAVMDLKRTSGDLGSTETVGSTEPEATGGGAPPTVFVAASDASAASQAMAHYVCDGTADQDQINSATQECFELAEAGGYNSTDSYAPGGRVLLSEGTFHISGAIDERNPEVGFNGPPNMTLQGMGITATRIKQTGSDFAIVSYGQGFRLCDLTIDGSAAGVDANTYGGAGVYCGGAHSRVERVRFYMVGYQNLGNVHLQEDNSRVQDCEFLYPQRDGAGVYIDSSAGHCIVTNNYFLEIPVEAINTTAPHVIVMGNSIEWSQRNSGGTTAVVVGTNSVVVGNICRDWAGSPATITSGAGSQVANNVLL